MRVSSVRAWVAVGTLLVLCAKPVPASAQATETAAESETETAAETAAESETDTAAETASEDWPEVEREERDQGLWLRLILEGGEIKSRRDYRGGAQSTGTETSFSDDEHEYWTGWGARTELGYSLGFGSGFGIVPRGAVSVVATEGQERQRTLASVDHVWSSHPWWWSLSVGAEFQMLARALGVSLDVGVAGLAGGVTPLAPDEGTVELVGVNAGILGRAATNLRLPLDFPFNVGAIAAAEGYLWPAPFNSRVGGKLSLGLLVEWDEGRR